MKSLRLLLVPILAFAMHASHEAFAAKKPGGVPPHTPTLIFYLSNVSSQRDADAITASVARLKSVMTNTVNLAKSYALVRFDSHIVSYHQVAQAIGDADKTKRFDPRLRLIIPDYAQADNAAKVDAVLAGKRLNQRVKIELMDKTKGMFLLHFLPLEEADSASTGPQGFNGGHIHHPISDAPPRGLGLPCTYASDDS